jgi:hypothetical protein
LKLNFDAEEGREGQVIPETEHHGGFKWGTKTANCSPWNLDMAWSLNLDNSLFSSKEICRWIKRRKWKSLRVNSRNGLEERHAYIVLSDNPSKTNMLWVLYLTKWDLSGLTNNQSSRCSIVVSILACHARDPGSIPGNGDFNFNE